jgi:hypothetical protein
MSFKPNCICREGVAVAVISPAVGEGAGVNVTGFGVLKFARFNRL